MTREALLKDALKLIEPHNRLIIKWATGVGKSKAAIEIHKKAKTSLNRPLRVLLVVAETAHKDNWRSEYTKWSNTALWEEVTVECYASLKNYKDTEWDLLILDEAHHSFSEIRIDILQSIISKYVVVLSASLSLEDGITLFSIYGKFNMTTVTLKDAINWKILPKPEVYLIPLTLDNTTNNQTIIEKWGTGETSITCMFDERYKYLTRLKYPNSTLIIKCTQAQKYKYLDEQFNFWKSRFFNTRLPFVKLKWLRTGLIRKNFLGECKTEHAKQLLNIVKKDHLRYICFCANISQANDLGGKNVIHSKIKNPLTIVDKFNNRDINNIFAVGMLQEGMNLTDIHAGIIIQLDGAERSFIQKFGRTLRAKNPIQYVLYYPNTKDEEYLDNVLENVDHNYIVKVEDISELKD